MKHTFFDMLESIHDIHLNPQQKAVVFHKDGPCLVLAVPGGGKTTTLLARTAYLIIHEEVDPQAILSITFSRMSANDMKSRFEHIFGQQINDHVANAYVPKVNFATIHSFSYRVVMAYNKSIGQVPRLIEGNDAGQWSKTILLRKIYQQVTSSYINDNELDSLINDLSYVKNMMLSRKEISGFKSDVSGFHDIYKQYEAFKRENNCIDFDDMLVQCYGILSEHPKVLKAYQNKYRYVQVDEAQDTSKLQHEIIGLLVAKHKNLFYVADDDQSIYGFRAAFPSYLLKIKDHYPEAVVYKMEQNYRSTASIVDICNQLIKSNKERYDKNIVTENAIGSSIELLEVEQRYLQMELIIKEMIELNLDNVAVLYRNNQSAISLAKHLADHQIPFFLKDFKNRFFTHWAVKDMLSILKFAQCPSDLTAFSQFYYRLRGYYISKQMIDYCENASVGISVFDTLLMNRNLNAHQQKNIEKLARHFEHLAIKTPSKGINYILDVMGYREFLMDRASTSDVTYDTYLDMVIILRNLARECEDYEGLIGTIHMIQSIMKDSVKNQGKAAVTLSTMHSSKGLEWSNVYLIDLIEGVFPNRDVVKQAGDGNVGALEEERRLFYVAMTRAKSNLKLMTIKGGPESLFVREVDELMFPEKRIKREALEKKQRRQRQLVASGASKPAYSGVKKMMFNSPKRHLDIKPLKKGTRLIHQTFGEGRVVSCDNERVHVTFVDKERALNLRVLVEEGLIKLIE